MTAKIAIIKTGSTHAKLIRLYGDFDQWFQRNIQSAEFTTYDIEQGVSLPACTDFDGYIITGSPRMVTEKLDWSVELEDWIRLAVKQEVKLLAVCYGHQLLAEALGGQAGWHPRGREIGTVNVQLTTAGLNDALLGFLPARFSAQATHAQSALKLPADAVLLAANEFEPNHAFRLGNSAWGVQFHPEFSADIMRGYLFETADKLLDDRQPVAELINRVHDADAASNVIDRFVALCQHR
ncbi:glutamine amidotransferase [Ketobacter sp. MCCC 1A13808]|uniref:glutamine amidotransferase n=1 Tax=Ketobacter sp. MCCC 1A13808 TaxID=2602738 RepID=UPI000F1D2E54|nr:glutamine amidotransferase [Ketobacter sp. MCCC 1A13808]MVF12623.1 glutamine amidotransferase [Ketobacter sp. MCCC 1A13808]RLP55578.1 MAG: glutamine amidotransferase [Ketobacter sp.]